MTTKRDKLIELMKEAQADKSLPLHAGANKLVFGNGDPESRFFFLGEAPGFNEDQQGIPFCGRAGKLLNETLDEIEIPRQTIWISNVVYFRPPENRDPFPEELEGFRSYVDRQLEIVDPSIIVTLGRFSMGKFLPEVKISQVHGKPRYVVVAGKKRILVPMYHPAAALRGTTMMQAFKNDFLVLPRILKKIEAEEEEIKKKSQEGTQEQLF